MGKADVGGPVTPDLGDAGDEGVGDVMADALEAGAQVRLQSGCASTAGDSSPAR